MRLKLHPDSRCAAVNGIDVSVLRGAAGRLQLEYRTSGLPQLGKPDAAGLTEPMRADELWRHTCFEAFVRAPAAEAYYEFNFSPHLQWAAYRFESYRRDRKDVEVRPSITTRTGGGAFELSAELALNGLPGLGGSWRLALSAVIEEANGRMSYWALAHPPGSADFHQTDGFALELPAI